MHSDFGNGLSGLSDELELRVVGTTFQCEVNATISSARKQHDVIKLPFGMECLESDLAQEADASKVAKRYLLGQMDSESEKDELLDSESEVENEEEVAASPPNLGIVAFEKSPSSIAMCYVCNTKIMKGCWRFDYRLTESTKHMKFDWKNVKRVHAR